MGTEELSSPHRLALRSVASIICLSSPLWWEIALFPDASRVLKVKVGLRACLFGCSVHQNWSHIWKRPDRTTRWRRLLLIWCSRALKEDLNLKGQLYACHTGVASGEETACWEPTAASDLRLWHYTLCIPCGSFYIPAADRNGEREDGAVPNVPAPGSDPRASGPGFGCRGL
jgi:hypothetical protein